jgi:hypothetical protein
VHNRAQLYHVHHKPLYHAIGEPDSRFRRAVPARAATERLMRLDAALMSADVEWLTTPAEKLAWRRASTGADSPDHRDGAPVPPDAVVANPLPGTFPIGLGSRGDLVVLYVATVPWTDDFRTFLIGHADILGVASAWTVRLVFPPALRRAVTAHQAVTSEELEHPLSAEHVRELRHYFFHTSSTGDDARISMGCPSRCEARSVDTRTRSAVRASPTSTGDGCRLMTPY